MVAGGHANHAAVLGVTLAFTIFAVFAACLRLWTRLCISKVAGADDAFIAVSSILAVALTVSIWLQVKYGLSHHVATLTEHDVLWTTIWFWHSIWIYQAALSAAKISILLQYRRIFPQPWFRKIGTGLIAFVFLFFVWTTCNAVFACFPVEYFWKRTIDPNAKGHCLNREAIWFSNAGLNILSDCAIAIAPLPIVRSLNLPRRQKIALSIIFGIGVITCIASLLRLQAIYVASDSQDFTWDGPMGAVWSSLEVNTCIICSCLPMLKSCIVRYFPRIFSSLEKTGHAHSRSTHMRKVGREDFAHGIGLDYLARRKANTAVCNGPTSRWERDERTSVGNGSSTTKSKDGIQAVTVVQQDTMDTRGDNGEPSDSESTRKLVRVML